MKTLFFRLSILLLLTTIVFRSVTAQTTITLGTGNSPEYYPFSTFYEDARTQILYTAAELNAAGSYGGLISSIAFNVSFVNTQTMNGFNIKIQQVAQTSLNAYLSSTFTQVYSGSPIITSLGWKTFNFTTPFLWNGTSSIVVEICFDNTNYTTDSKVFCTNNSAKTVTRRQDNETGCTLTGGSTKSNRPNTRFGVSAPSSNDFSAVEFTLPSNGSAANANMPISIKVKNTGNATQSAYSVKYSIDNGSNWTTKAVSSALASYATNNVTFTGTQTADMSSPGIYQCIGVVARSGDTITNNDTIRKIITICSGALSGVYTIGSDTASDFPSLNSAISSMELCGVSGPINLKIKPGFYNSQVRIGPITGISASAPLTIESLSGDRNSVVFEYAAINSDDNYVFKLDTCNFVTIKNITIKASGLNDFARSIDMYASNNCTIDGNYIYNINNTSSNFVYSRDNIYLASNAISSNNVFKNNTIKNGFYGIFLKGTYSNRTNNSLIINNIFENNTFRSIDVEYANSIEVISNKISNLSTNSQYGQGIKINNCTGTQRVIKNKIVTYNTTALNLNSMSGTSSIPVTVANNFIHQTNASNSTILLNNNSYLNICYNSIHLKGNSSYSKCLDIGSGSYLSIYNNNLINKAGGYTISTNSPSSILNIDYNNYYSTGNNIAYWSGYRNYLTNLQSASGKDSHSVNNNVSFYSDDDLHIIGSILNGLGTPVTGINDDYDGEPRDPLTPDIGADEFGLFPNDAGISEFVNLENGCPGTSQTISIKISNYGTSGIANVNVGWSVNGNNQTPYVWSGLLGLLNSTNATIGSYTFSADTTYEIKAWVNTVNLVNDSNNINDTLIENNYQTSMPGGIYQIGSSSSADFYSISSAISAMNSSGICGPIVFNIENGTYTGSYDIPYVNGASTTNTITLQSLSGDTSNVKFINSSTNSNSYIFQFNGSGYFKFKNLSFNTTNSTYSKVFNIINSARHITIDSCNLVGNNNTTSNSTYDRMIDFINSTQLVISNTTIKNGSDAIYISGSNSNLSSGIIVKNNRIINYTATAIRFNYLGDTVIIHNNYIEGKQYGIITDNTTKKINITSNIIKVTAISNTNGAGLHILSHNSQNNQLYASEINNNFIEISSSLGSSNSVYGILLYNSKYNNVYYNTVKVRNSATNTSASFHSYSNTNVNLKNNIFDAGNHYAMYVSNTYNLSSSNYNSFYSTHSYPIYYSGNRTFGSYKSLSNKDGNSKWGQPNYLATDDLHIHDVTLNNAGTTIPGITVDIDGDPRGYGGSPDIGADEFNILANDVQLYAINTPYNETAVGSNPIKVAIRNMGTSNIILDSLHYSLDNGATTSIGWTGNLAPLAIDSLILIGTESLTAGIHTVKAWSSYPNYAPDLNTINDTLEKTFVAQAMPLITVNPTSISGTITNCNDSLLIPLTIKNNGNATLNYALDTSSNSSYVLQVLVLTNGASYYSTMVAALGQTFTNYQVTTSAADNASTLQSAIIGKDVIIVPYISSYSAINAYATFATTFQTFANDGGVIIFAGQSYTNTITYTGLWSNFTNNGSNNSGSNFSMPAHSITNNFTASDKSSANDTYYFVNDNLVPTNFTTLINYNTSYKVAGYFPYGDGTVFYLGFRYRYTGKILQSKLLSNTLEWAYNNRNGWLSSSTTSGSVNAGDSTTINIELNSLGLTNGAYYSDLSITSNDLTSPNVIVPCTLNVAGSAVISSNNSSVNFNSQFNNVAAYDSVQIYNSGCGDLIISGITTNNTAYTTTSYDNTLSPGDSTWVVYKLLASTSGSYAATSTIASNIANFTIYLTGSTVTSPVMVIAPTTLNITIPNCNDSVITNLSIQNTGGGTLSANFTPSSDSAHIIVLTYGSNSQRSNMISSFGYSFNNYDYIELNTTNASILQSNINTHNTNIIVIPEISNSSTSAYMNLATTLQNFTNAGGTVIFGSAYYSNILTVTGLISGIRQGQIQGSLSTQNTNDPITENFPSSISSGYDYYSYFTFTGTGITSLLKYGTYDVCVRKQYGAGQVIVLGYAFTYINNSPFYSKQVVSNSIKSATSGSEWLAYSYTTSTVSAGNTVVKPITFRSAGLNAGVHTGSIKITTNSPTSPIVFVPCTLTVQNQMQNGVDLGNDTNSCGPIVLNAGPGFNSYVWSTGNTTQTITASTSGTYSVTVSNGGECSASDTIVVAVVTSSSASITGLPSTTCTSNGNITLTGFPYGGMFVGPGLTGNIFNPAIAGPGTHNIFYTYTGATCTTTATQPITIIASPVTSFTGLAASYCPNDPAVGLVGTPIGGTFSGNGMISNIFYPAIAGFGSHDISYSYTGASGCVGYDTNSVIIGNTSININILLSSTSFCLGDSPTTIFTSPAGGTLSGNGIIGNIFYPNIAGVGSHFLKYVVTSATTCDAIDSIQVIVGETPTGLAISGLPATFCYNAADVNINVFPAGGTLSGYGITGNTFSPSIASVGVHTITYTVTNGCSTTITQNTEVLAPPTITFNSMQSSYCENDEPFIVTVNPVGGNLTGDALVGSIFNPSLGNTGSNYIYYNYTDANSCSNNDSFNVVINNSPTANINTITNSFCSTSPTEALLGTPAGGVFSGNGVVGTNFDPSIAGAGMHYVKYTYTDNNGCSKSDSSTANVTAVHNVNAGSDALVNYNSTSQLSGLISGGSGPFVFSWTPTNKVVNPTQLSSSTINLTTSTSFTLNVTDNSNSCENHDEVIITVNGGALGGTSIATPATICDGGSSQLQALGSGGSSSNYSYAWISTPAGFTSNISNPIVNPSVSTTYSCLINDGANDYISNVIITVNNSPNATITNLDTVYCSNDAMVQLTVTPPNGTLTGGGISGFSFIPSVAPLGYNTIIYSIMGSNGCYGADTVQVLVGAIPSAFAGNDTVLPCNNGGLNLGQQPINGVSYLWNPVAGLTDATIANPALSFNASMNYTLKATDNLSGCNSTDNIDIQVSGAPITSTNNDTLVCTNSTVILSATGGSSYFWSNGDIGNTTTVSPLASTLYYVIVSDAGCSTVDTVWVNISDPNPQFGSDTTICANTSITLDAGAGNTSNDWSNGSTNQTITIDSTGIGYGSISIDVAIMDNLGCIGGDTIIITFVNCTGLNNLDAENFIMSIYPNPTKGQFTISSNETSIAKLKLEVLDLNGRLIYENQLLNTRGIISEKVDLSHRAKGIYIVRLSNGSMVKTFKVVVQ